MHNNNVLRLPIKAIIYWNLFTLLLFIVSPYDWDLTSSSYSLLLIFVCVNILFLYFGYRSALRTKINLTRYRDSKMVYIFWFRLALVVKILWLIPGYNSKLGLDLFDVTGLIERLSIGFIFSLGESYNLRQATELSQYSFPIFLVTSLLNSLSMLVIPLGVLLWKKINAIIKILLITTTSIDLVYWIGIGTNVGIFNIFLSLVFMLIVAKPDIISLGNYSLRMKIIIITATISLGSFFALSIADRFNLNYRGNYNMYDNYIVTSKVEQESLILKLTPESFHNNVIIASNYLNQGYFHLAMSFNEEYDFTYGLGNNYTTVGVSKKLIGIDVLPLTYVGKLENQGVGPFAAWHTAYMWFANDVTFYGVPFIMYILGYLFAITWRHTLYYSDPFAPILFLLLLFQLVYLTANNHVLSFQFFPLLIILSLRQANQSYHGLFRK